MLGASKSVLIPIQSLRSDKSHQCRFVFCCLVYFFGFFFFLYLLLFLQINGIPILFQHQAWLCDAMASSAPCAISELSGSTQPLSPSGWAQNTSQTLGVLPWLACICMCTNWDCPQS